MKLLLIQIRDDQVMRDHEFNCVIKRSGLSAKDIIRFDAIGESVTLDLLNGIDALVIGGSGEYSVAQKNNLKVNAAIISLIIEARKRRLPMLGICYGAHVLAEAFGGKVIKDKEHEEVGTHTVTTNSYAKNCPIFSQMPHEFSAQFGHSDHIVELPVGAVNLASSSLSAIQAFVFPGEPIYGLTFHPELDEQALLERIEYYTNTYDWSPEAVQQMKSSIGKTPEAQRVLKLFLDEIVTNGLVYVVI
ncbi:MAG: gamma-glutamyl-gamma-aminobutyrate hydrolase family protein [Candidatus Uhrbacteria bacterium]|nr:gamma-glutamyl-gamma-aminobutyrate hydrolase family protein [Candidatus Uhrbacteria bacterium]